MTKHGPDGALRILVTVDEEPERGEHYHLSASYPSYTPTPDEMLAVLTALLPGGQYGAMTPESHLAQALHGHVVHLIEDTPAYAARRADIPPIPKTSTSTLARAWGATPCAASRPSMPTAPRSSHHGRLPRGPRPFAWPAWPGPRRPATLRLRDQRRGRHALRHPRPRVCRPR